MKITLEVSKKYGQWRAYPQCVVGIALAEWKGKVTFSRGDVEFIRNRLQFEVELVDEPR